MVGLRIIGRLGNAMFVIATGEYWRACGHDVRYNELDPWFHWVETTFNNSTHVREYKSIFPNFNWEEFSEKLSLPEKRIPFKQNVIIPVEGIEYIGYFQSEKNFPDRELIELIFEPSEDIRKKVMDYNDIWLNHRTCSIHVRRDDYLKAEASHGILGAEYYEKAINTLNPFKIDRFLIFSDDITWCQQNFAGEKFLFIDEIDYVSLFMMARCDHHIIANSTFSWWGAWLGETEDSVVICPDKWFGERHPADMADDLIPKRWIKI